MKLKRLTNKEIRLLNRSVNSFGIDFKKGKEIYSLVIDDKKAVLVKDQIFFFYYNNTLIPSLHTLIKYPSALSNMKRVVVDMGAVKFVVNGADIMRPGIVNFDDFSKNEPVVIVDVDNKLPLAIGLSIYNSDEIRNMTKGKVIKNLHFINDTIWNFKRN